MMDGLGPVLYLVGHVILMPMIGYACASGKNRGGLGAILGLLFGPLGIIIALLLPPGRRPRPRYEYGRNGVRIR